MLALAGPWWGSVQMNKWLVGVTLTHNEDSVQNCSVLPKIESTIAKQMDRNQNVQHVDVDFPVDTRGLFREISRVQTTKRKMGETIEKSAGD